MSASRFPSNFPLHRDIMDFSSFLIGHTEVVCFKYEYVLDSYATWIQRPSPCCSKHLSFPPSSIIYQNVHSLSTVRTKWSYLQSILPFCKSSLLNINNFHSNHHIDPVEKLLSNQISAISPYFFLRNLHPLTFCITCSAQ